MSSLVSLVKDEMRAWTHLWLWLGLSKHHHHLLAPPPPPHLHVRTGADFKSTLCLVLVQWLYSESMFCVCACRVCVLKNCGTLCRVKRRALSPMFRE